MAYLVTYQLGTPGQPRTSPSNVILRHTHPVTWAANPPAKVRALKQVTYLLFWETIPDDVVAAAEGWCTVED